MNYLITVNVLDPSGGGGGGDDGGDDGGGDGGDGTPDPVPDPNDEIVMLYLKLVNILHFRVKINRREYSTLFLKWTSRCHFVLELVQADPSS